MLEDEGCVEHFIKGTADGDEVGEELVGVVKMVAKDVGMDLSEMGSRFVTVEKTENPPLNLSAPSVHMHNQTATGEWLRECSKIQLLAGTTLLFEKGIRLKVNKHDSCNSVS